MRSFTQHLSNALCSRVKREPHLRAAGSNFLRIRKGAGFTEKVLAVVKKIPRGKTFSYAEVARRAGSPRAFRAVGSILKKNFDPAIPCHRVIKSDGSLGEYNRGTPEKARKLRAEGVIL
jgi:O-6-methylguanine DNA methyltransferase